MCLILPTSVAYRVQSMTRFIAWRAEPSPEFICRIATITFHIIRKWFDIGQSVVDFVHLIWFSCCFNSVFFLTSRKGCPPAVQHSSHMNSKLLPELLSFDHKCVSICSPALCALSCFVEFTCRIKLCSVWRLEHVALLPLVSPEDQINLGVLTVPSLV